MKTEEEIILDAIKTATGVEIPIIAEHIGDIMNLILEGFSYHCNINWCGECGGRRLR
jgi:hypothetical protein